MEIKEINKIIQSEDKDENRSTSFRSRKNSLEEIKKKLKENMNDE